MKVVAPGETRPVTLTNLAEGLVGTLGVRVEVSENVIVQERETTGVTEFAKRSYCKWITLPEEKVQPCQALEGKMLSLTGQTPGVPVLRPPHSIRIATTTLAPAPERGR